MTTTTDQAIYRARTCYRKAGIAKGYRHSLEMLDEGTQQVLATCDLVGRASFAELTLLDEHQQPWRMRPNRKLMPSRWIVTDPQQRIVMQFEQNILGKLSNPLHKVCVQPAGWRGQDRLSPARSAQQYCRSAIRGRAGRLGHQRRRPTGGQAGQAATAQAQSLGAAWRAEVAADFGGPRCRQQRAAAHLPRTCGARHAAALPGTDRCLRRRVSAAPLVRATYVPAGGDPTFGLGEYSGHDFAEHAF